MTFDLKEFLRLKEAAQKKRRDLDRAHGELDSLIARLDQAFHCMAPEMGIKKMQQLKQEMVELTATYSKKLAEFEQEFGGKL